MPWLKSKLPIFAVLASVGTACVMFGRTTSAVTPAALMVSPCFEPAPCPFTPAADQVEGLTVSCGFVLVPENRSRPEGNWIRLAVAIFKSPTVATRPPLIFWAEAPVRSFSRGLAPSCRGRSRLISRPIAIS